MLMEYYNEYNFRIKKYFPLINMFIWHRNETKNEKNIIFLIYAFKLLYFEILISNSIISLILIFLSFVFYYY
jgi:hypothetical protein